MSRTCQNCYSKIKDEHRFCTQCGTKFEEKISTVSKEENNNIKQEALVPFSSHVKFIVWGIVLCIFIFAISNFTKESDQSVSNIGNSLPVELNNIQIKKTVDNAEVKDEMNMPTGYESKENSTNIDKDNIKEYLNLNKKENEDINELNIDNRKIKEFIENYLWKMGSGFYFNRLYPIKNAYSENVKYRNMTITTKEKVFEDKINYLDRWPYLQYQLVKINEIITIPNEDKIRISFDIKYKQWNFKGKGIQGDAQYVLEINSNNKIIAEESIIKSKYNFDPVLPSKNNLPFHGTKRFNFSGIGEDWNSLTLRKSGKYEFSNYGEHNISEMYKNGVMIIENQLCDKTMNLCTEMED